MEWMGMVIRIPGLHEPRHNAIAMSNQKLTLHRLLL